MPELKEYTLEEVQKHCEDGDSWLVFQGDVYDVSQFKHPGGKEAVERNWGEDATDKMMGVEAHSKHLEGVQKYLGQLKIGTIKK